MAREGDCGSQGMGLDSAIGESGGDEKWRQQWTVGGRQCGDAFRWRITAVLFDRRAEAEAVAVGISYGEFAQAPGLIDRRNVNGRFRPSGRVEAARTKGGVALVHIINKDAIDGAEDTVSRMA